MTEMTMRLRVDLPPAFDLVRPYAELLEAATAVVHALGFGPDAITYDGPPGPAHDLLHTVAAAQRRCRDMVDAPVLVAPRSSGDVILELTDRVAALSELVGVNYRARRAVEMELARVWKRAGASDALIEGGLAELSGTAMNTGDAP